MASTIITKNSSTASATPAVGDLQQGELAVNVTDKKIYTKDSSAAIVKLVGSLGNQEASAVAITGGSIAGITDLAVADGGTGSSTAAGARSNLSAAASGANSDITSLSGLTTALSVAQGGTGVSSSTGSGSVVLSNSPTLVTPALGTPSAAVLTNATGLPLSTGISGLGTGVATFLGTPSSANLLAAVTDETGTGALVFANSPTLVTPALGTPSSATLTNATGLPISTGVSGLGTGVATFLATPSSSNLASAVSDETGSGALVFATSPTLVTPALGTPSSATLTNATGLPISTGVSGLGTGVATALAVNVGSAGAPVVNGGALGTPSSGTVTNLTGTASININGTVGATTPTTGAFTTVAASSSVTLSGGTANGVAYLNGSKVLTTGSALTFDGTTLGLTNTSTSANNTTTGSFLTGGTLSFRSRGASAGIGGNTYSNQIISNNGTYVDLEMYTIGTSTNLVFGINAAEQMRLTSTGLGIGTSSPSFKLDVSVTDTTAYSTSAYSYEPVRITNQGAGGVSGILFQALSTGTANTAQATISAIAESASSKNTALTFGTRENSGGTLPERMRLDSAGNLGLGVTPSAWESGRRVFQMGTPPYIMGSGTSLEFLANAYFNGTNWIYNSNGAATYYAMNVGSHTWYTAASGTAGNAISFTQAMTLDASGNLGVGTTSPSARFHSYAGATSQAGIFEANNSVALLSFASNTTSSYTRVQLGAAGNDMVLYTTGTERARIDSGGALLVNRTSVAGAELFNVTGGASGSELIRFYASHATNPYGQSIIYTTADPNGTANEFLSCYAGGSTIRAAIRSNGGLANYSGNNVNLSDRREKTNFAPATSYLDKICAIPVQTFNYIDQNLEEDGGLTLGVVAQDVQAVAPELVMESDWSAEKDGSKMRLSIYQTDLQYALMKCIQEQQAIIESLKARLDAANL